jgi:adenylate cyclase
LCRALWRILRPVSVTQRLSVHCASGPRHSQHTTIPYERLDLLYPIEHKNFEQAGVLFAKAIEKEPTFAMPHAWLARWYNHRVGLGWCVSASAGSAQALDHGAQAVELDRRNGLALAICGHIKSFLFHDYDSALDYFDRALTARPSGSLGWALSSATLSYVGRAADAIQRAEHALRLSPIDQGLFYYHAVLSLAHYAAGEYLEAIKWGRVASSENPDWTSNLRYLAAALAAAYRQREAREVAEIFKARDPTFSLSQYSATRNPFRDSFQRNLHLEHLRQAGLRD